VFSGNSIGCCFAHRRGTIAAWPRSPAKREFSIINISLNMVERGYQAKVYKFNNRKDDAVFSKDRSYLNQVEIYFGF
jgi:hypothetical protein